MVICYMLCYKTDGKRHSFLGVDGNISLFYSTLGKPSERQVYI